jgi:lipopolysaccharide/colanic/teichoic acid biosynthesis glycosyltransferase
MPDATPRIGLLRRSLDLVAASTALLVLSPLLLLIAALVRLTSPGPVLFRCAVAGWQGREFTCFKFRTMFEGAHALRSHLLDRNEASWPIFKMRSDPRITPVGRILRKYSLDELPQLWNILRGDMTLVGPRPVLKDEWREFDGWERRKLDLVPGAFSLWLIRGQPRDLHTWVHLDLEYQERRSLLLDLEIILRGLWFMVSGKNY